MGNDRMVNAFDAIPSGPSEPEVVYVYKHQFVRLLAIEAAAKAICVGSMDTGLMTEVSTEKFDALCGLITS